MSPTLSLLTKILFSSISYSSNMYFILLCCVSNSHSLLLLYCII
nr:MAG TPA: hypothetical protein [Caudoviricetes sp.]